MADISEFSDEPGKVWKLTGPSSISSPGGEPPTLDYAALATQAATAHHEANKRYSQALQDSQLGAFWELVFTCAAGGIVTIKLSPSDQGDYMTIDEALDAEGNDLVDDLDDLYDTANDLPDTIDSHWAILPGVTYEDSRRYGDTATIDITVAAPAAVEAVRQEWLDRAPEGVTPVVEYDPHGGAKHRVYEEN